MRYSYTHWIFRPVSMVIWISLSIILGGCFLALLIVGSRSFKDVFSLPLSPLLWVFVLQYIPSFAADFFTLFWEEADL